jgi:hypothetical protein
MNSGRILRLLSGNRGLFAGDQQEMKEAAGSRVRLQMLKVDELGVFR